MRGSCLSSLFIILMVTLPACSFSETVPATYQCSAERPTCPAGMECRGDLCVPVGSTVTDLVIQPRDGSVEGAHRDVGIAGDLGSCTPLATLACTTTLLGPCAPGERICSSEGAWGPCDALVQPAEEICDNNIDDDCDGPRDSQDPSCQACEPDSTLDGCISDQPGICTPGQQTCVAQQDGTWDWGQCIPKVQPGSQLEVKGQSSCSNGLDDDCDTKVDADDEDCQDCTVGDSTTCSTGLPGACGPGHKTCQPGGSWGACEQDVAQSTELCTGGVDEDCDTLIDSLDETCRLCTPGTDRPCDTGLDGVCAAGREDCELGGNGVYDWSGDCVQETASSAEVCTSQLDEDCDGDVSAADSDCWICGDGVAMGDEDCDGTDFGGSDCTTGGFDQGTLSCRGAHEPNACTIIYTGCYTCTAPTPPSGVTPTRIVDVATGDDGTPDGLCIAYKTITAALTGTASGDVVWVAPGTYDKNMGEKFSIKVPAGVTLIGNEAAQGVGTSIKGQGVTVSGQGVGTVTLDNGSVISGFQILFDPTGPYETTTNRTVFIYQSKAPARISHNRIMSNSNGSGIYFFRNNATTEILHNYFSSARIGVELWGYTTVSPKPKLRDNYFAAQNNYAIYVVNNDTNPDLGKDLVLDPGNNTFAPSQKAMRVHTSATVYAIGNDWPVDPPRCYSDTNTYNYEIEVAMGAVVWSPGEMCVPR